MGAWPPTMRSGCAVGSDIDVNQARIDSAAGLPVDRQPLRHAGAEIMQQDVGSRDQLMNDLLAFRTLQVDLNGFLAGVIFEIHRPHAAARADGLLPLRSGVDFEYPHAHFRQHLRRVRPRDHHREVQHREAVEKRLRRRAIMSVAVGLLDRRRSGCVRSGGDAL